MFCDSPGTPKNIKYNNVKLALESIEGVVAAHSLHIWSLTMSKAALAVHLAIGTCMLCYSWHLTKCFTVTCHILVLSLTGISWQNKGLCIASKLLH